MDDQAASHLNIHLTSDQNERSPVRTTESDHLVYPDEASALGTYLPIVVSNTVSQRLSTFAVGAIAIDKQTNSVYHTLPLQKPSPKRASIKTKHHSENKAKVKIKAKAKATQKEEGKVTM